MDTSSMNPKLGFLIAGILIIGAMLCFSQSGFAQYSGYGIGGSLTACVNTSSSYYPGIL
jgi:hypothetical protein